MKVAFISMLPLPWGGSEELWAAAAASALKAGHEVGLWVYAVQAGSPKVVALREAGAKVFTRRVLPGGRFGKYLSPVFRPFAELPAFRPDVVCVAQPNTYAVVEQADFAPAMRFLAAAGTPVVVVCQWNADHLELSPASRAVVRDFFARAYRVAFVSDANRRTALRHLADPLPNAVIVDNPVNLSDLSGVPWPATGPVRMACVARLSAAYKGQDLLLETLAGDDWRSRDWRLSFCGSGPDREHLEALARLYGLADRVRWMGHLPDVRSIWAEHEILLLPSRSEGTPLALVEAMVCGRPAVVTDAGGNAERIEEGVTGFVAEAPTVRSFSAALERAWASRGLWPDIGCRARKTALSRLDPDPGNTLLRKLVKAANSPLDSRDLHLGQ